MKFSLKLTNNKTYCEVGQVNPLRWKTLFREGDTFIDQSGWIKCKDFFNDTVAFFKEGSVFSIYSYDNNIKKNDEGVYFLLKNIADMPTFCSNLDVMNQQLKADLGCHVGLFPQPNEEKNQCIVLIPNELWETTYRISMVTYIIRLSNYGYKYTDWNSIWSTMAPSHTLDHAFSPAALKNAKQYGFKPLPGYEKYWWYCGEQYNSEVLKGQTGLTIHNNGCSSWSMYMKG